MNFKNSDLRRRLAGPRAR